MDISISSFIMEYKHVNENNLAKLPKKVKIKLKIYS